MVLLLSLYFDTILDHEYNNNEEEKVFLFNSIIVFYAIINVSIIKMVLQLDYLILFFYHVRKSFPKSQLYYSIYSLLKYLGLILITHNIKRLEDNLFSISKVINLITLFGSNYTNYISSYLYISSILVILLLSMIIYSIVLILLFKKQYHSKNKTSLITIPLTLSTFQKISIKIIAISWTIISLFSQHLIEYFSLGLFNIIFIKQRFLDTYNDSSYLKYIIAFICILGVLICEANVFFFYYFSKSFSHAGDVGDHNISINFLANIILILTSSTQGIITLMLHLPNGISNHYVLNFIMIFVILIQLILNVKEYNYYHNNYALVFERFLLYWIMISSLDELVIYYTCENSFSQSYSLCKIVLEVINSIILAKFNIQFINRFYLNRFIKKTFNEKGQLEFLDLLSYERMLYEYKQKKLPFNSIFHLFSFHKEHCTLKGCSCHQLLIDKWITRIQDKANFILPNVSSNAKLSLSVFGPTGVLGEKDFNEKSIVSGNNNTNTEIQEYQIIQESFEDFVMIGEHEITKAINALIKSSRSKSHILEKLIALHIEYILNIKNDLRSAFYFASQYISLGHVRLSFLYKMYIFEFKYESYIKMTNEKVKGVQKVLGEQTLSQKHKVSVLFNKSSSLYSYMLEMQSIIELLIKCCDFLYKIVDFRKNVEIKSGNVSSFYMKSENFIKLCYKYKKNHLKLDDKLLKSKKKLKHYEICYMLTLYFQFLMQSVPSHLQKVFKVVTSYDMCSLSKGRCNSYKHYNVMNPLMIFINKKDDFIIKYIAISLCNELNYQKQELINTSFEQLIPTETISLHKIIMKKFFMTSNMSYNNKKFILDRNKNLLPVTMNAKPLPSLEQSFGISLSFEFRNEYKSTEKTYYLLLDRDWKIISMNRDFSEEFFFTLQMLTMLKLTFPSFFGVNYDKIKSKATSFFNKDKRNIISLEEENQVLIPFSHGKQESIFQDRQTYDIKAILKRIKKIIIHEQISKYNFVKNLENINQMIDELGFDIEWYTRVNCLKDRMMITNSSFNMTSIYTIIKLEKLVYTIVDIRETVLQSQKLLINSIKESINKLDFYNLTTLKPRPMESTGSITKYENNIRKYKNKKSFNLSLSSHNNTLTIPTDPLTLDLLSSKKLSNNNLLQSPLSSFKTNSNTNNNTTNGNNIPQSSASGLASSSQNSMLGMNKTNVALLNLSSAVQKRSLLEKSQMNLTDITYETRTPFQHNILKQRLQIIYKVLCCCLVVLGLFSFLLNSSLMNESMNLFTVNIYAILLKSDIYFASLNILTSCEYAGPVDNPALLKLRDRLKRRAEELIDHFTTFNQALNSLVDQSRIDPIFVLINSNDPYNLMMPNFSIKLSESGINDQIFTLHYYLKQMSLSDSFKSCRLDIFLKKQWVNMVGHSPGPTYEETIVFYVFTNVLFSVRSKMEDLVRTTNTVLRVYFEECKLLIILYNIAILFLELMICIAFSIIVITEKNNIQVLLNMIYTKHINEEKNDIQFKAYRMILENFTYENIKKYEKTITMNNDPLLDSPLIKSKDRRKTHRQSKLVKQDYLLDGKERVREFPAELTTPAVVKYSLAIIIVLIMVLFSIVIIDIFYSINLYNDLMFANIIAINFIDRIPKLTEILLYSKISIILNDIYYITTDPSEYDSRSYSNYYDISIDLSTSSIFDVLGNSEYSFLYYQFHQIKRNLDQFMYVNKNSDVLKEVITWENLFNTNEGLCIYSSIGYTYYFGHDNRIIPIMSSINTTAKTCKSYGNGMALTTLNNFITFANKEMCSTYSDFAVLDPNIRDPIKFIKSFFLSSYTYIIDDPLKKVHSTTIFFILKDLGNMYSESNMISFTFSLTLVIVSFIVFIFIHFYLISRIEKKIMILSFIQVMLSNKKIKKE